MSLYDPPRMSSLQAAYDRGWEAGPENLPVRDREQAGIAAIVQTVEAEIATDLEALVESHDEHVSCEEVVEAIARIARELRQAHQEHTGEIPVVPT